MADADRFAFGENWRRFLDLVDERRINEAERSLSEMLGRARLDGLRFCDVGSGSGLFSLAAWRLGATVHSFDFDSASVACTDELRRRFASGDQRWRVERGSVLDDAYLESLGQWDIVYAWGVLHHTGAMWDAMAVVTKLVAPQGRLYVALYNDQGWQSRAWWYLKRAYNSIRPRVRFLITVPVLLVVWGTRAVKNIGHRPFLSRRDHRSARGMSAWYDLVDWVGGFPYEVAQPAAVVKFYQGRGFQPERVRTTNGLGCNEFVFRRESPRD